jgi:hypothetical protein
MNRGIVLSAVATVMIAGLASHSGKADPTRLRPPPGPEQPQGGKVPLAGDKELDCVTLAEYLTKTEGIGQLPNLSD